MKVIEMYGLIRKSLRGNVFAEFVELTHKLQQRSHDVSRQSFPTLVSHLHLWRFRLIKQMSNQIVIRARNSQCKLSAKLSSMTYYMLWLRDEF